MILFYSIRNPPIRNLLRILFIDIKLSVLKDHFVFEKKHIQLEEHFLKHLAFRHVAFMLSQCAIFLGEVVPERYLTLFLIQDQF